MSWTEISPFEVTYTAQTKIRCFGCSRRLSRQRTFRAPVRDGVLRSLIRQELKDQAARWSPRGVCAECMRTGDYVMLDDGNFALRFLGNSAA